jgi:hypothetical protein
MVEKMFIVVGIYQYQISAPQLKLPFTMKMAEKKYLMSQLKKSEY